jgi:nucleotide-binding universal stress UspA family protein
MRVLVPVDGSAPANRAVAHAVALLRGRDDPEIVLVNVQGPQTLEVSDISAIMTVTGDRTAVERQAQRAMRRAMRICEEAGVPFAALTEIGPVADTIARIARRRHADQIVMGTRGRGALGRLFLGSVATRVAQLVSVPVTLIK